VPLLIVQFVGLQKRVQLVIPKLELLQAVKLGLMECYFLLVGFLVCSCEGLREFGVALLWFL
jgi:hypothetical protein